MPTVSIIVPVYNAEKGIRRCVDSILDQEYEDFECILVDDGSTDESPKILDEYAKKDKRVQVIHKPNSGVSSTRNLALSKATGKYIQFLDADDWIPDHSTKMLVREAEDKHVDLVIGDFYRVVGNNLARKGSIESNDVLTLQQFAEFMMESPSDFYYGVLWNKLYRNDIIQKYHVRMDENLSWCEDFIFNLEYLIHVQTVSALQLPVYYYVKTEGSLVSKTKSLAKVVNMKATVFSYYNDFYKHVLDEKQYRKDRLSIAGFILDAANDDGVIPMMPGTKKLGKENFKVSFNGQINDVISGAYYLEKAYEKILTTIALKYSLDIKEIKILATVHSLNTTDSISEISDLTGVSEMSITSTMPRLAMKGLLSITYKQGQLEMQLGKNTEALANDLDLALKDLEESMYKNMNPKDRETIQEDLLKVLDNLRKYVTNED